MKKFESIQEIQKVQEMACKVDEDVFFHSPDDTIRVDAKSFIGLFALDFSKEVCIVTESEWMIKKLSK
ncbi:MAG: hypothetical protein LBV08_07670 [Clostridiales bacterium]|nr:hypothetical protein [Clostridiales bacterium]